MSEKQKQSSKQLDRQLRFLGRLFGIILIALLLVLLVCIASDGELFLDDDFTEQGIKTGLDTVKAEIAIATKEIMLTENTKWQYPIKTVIIVEGFIEREKYSYYTSIRNKTKDTDYYKTLRYLDENKNEIKDFVWMVRVIDAE